MGNKKHLELIRFTFELAQKSRDKGNHPFGALLADSSGKILLESENTVVTENDITGHAECNLIRLASKEYDSNYLAKCTIYSSAEPCPMCCGAIYWSNVKKVVYGLSETKLYSLINIESEEILNIPCREILNKGAKIIEVIGPILENEGVKVHEGFWT